MFTLEGRTGFEETLLRTAGGAAALGALCGVAAGPQLLGGLPDPARLTRAAPWVGLVCSALVLALGLRERRRALRAGEPTRSRWRLLAAVALGLLGGLFGARSLPPLAVHLFDGLQRLPLLSLLPLALLFAVALALAAGALGLWTGAALLPLHLVPRMGTVEERLLSLRPTLDAELRPLADRVAALHRAALAELRAAPADRQLPLRSTLDQVALAALELSGRAAALGRSAPGAHAEEALRRKAELSHKSEAADDPLARASFVRAAQAQEQLVVRCRTLCRARERLLARLHEELAELEGARLSLALLSGAAAEQAAGELDLLDERLRAAALAAEAASGAEPAEAAHAPAKVEVSAS